MHAYVQIALIEKVKLIFAQDERLFLSFPLLRPINYQPENLAALLSPQTPADYANAADYARIVNFVPRDMVASDDGESVLWEIYQDVLDHAEHAAGITDPEGEARRKEAADLLYSVDADGLRHEASAYLTYRQYRDAWFVAQQNYNAQKITAETSTDPEIKRQWSQEIEPPLRLAVNQAMTDFENIGRKSSIEAALAVLASAADSAPGEQWQEWRKSFDPNIDLNTAGTTRFAPTGFSPGDIAQSSSWVKTALAADEMASLVASSDHAALAGDGGDFAGVSLEFRSVAVTRPWFNPEVLTSKIWRNAGGMEPLSDGTDPPGGRLPAYVSALVLVRNIEVTTKTASQPATGRLDFTIAAQLFTVRKLSAATSAATNVEPQMPPAEPAVMAVNNLGFARLRRASFDTAADAHLLAAPRFQSAAFKTMEFSKLSADSGIAAEAPKTAALHAGLFKLKRQGFGKALFTGLDQPATLAPPVPEPPPPSPPPPPPDNSISILAFICKRLPKAPDPRPGLTWL